MRYKFWFKKMSDFGSNTKAQRTASAARANIPSSSNSPHAQYCGFWLSLQVDGVDIVVSDSFREQHLNTWHDLRGSSCPYGPSCLSYHQDNMERDLKLGN